MMNKESERKSRALVFGHSHAWSFRRAIISGFTSHQFDPKVILCGTKEFPSGGWMRTPGGHPTLSPVLTSALHLAEKSDSDWLVSLVGGNYFNQVAMVIDEVEFDFVLKGRPRLPLNNGATFLPQAAVRALLEKHTEDFVVYAQLLAKNSDPKSTIIIGPPPPPSTENEVLVLIANDKSSRPGLKPSSPWLRLKLWYLQDLIIQKICSGLEVNYLSGAVYGAVDDNGFLLQKYVRDAVHADHNYAKIMLEEVGKIIGSKA